ncbi:tRNA uridine 5-carboxymethylaminomethyl modification enzyme GidA [Aedoeadaptatus nemausensis]|uniref:tRNA uridine 5-carboxymethylaminomethyl modification enzyme MnmG n=1 Tax=Aedoeadaptatus nemausensis TaxID=2582829 RepID=A0A6V6Y2W3_9FIRM|nr:tRNA uridine-5-carboxymethylaminomethyl(34) synthesis enzyme MnmG [Peptoniphilus nemausensis]CAC9928687.1 tRNA uridine 5-carboxymethylaminomethyl modification enzyme GidA [Peptoniphilus nemausensis]
MDFLAKTVDIVVVGAGHAGCEAALAAARMGMDVALITMNLNSIAAMNCNPNIGGTGKGHLVREIDALGGEIGRNIDKTFIQSRMLNRSKGPAVHSLRAQADKWDYHRAMKMTLEDEKNIHLIQDEVASFYFIDDDLSGVVCKTGAIYKAKKTILATGTYLRGRVFMGEVNYSSGPDGMQPADLLTESIEGIGIDTMRMKTGTPARVHRDSIDFSGMEVQKGDEEIHPFSFSNFDKDYSDKEQIDCYLTYTTPECHEIILENIERSAMAMGDIEGTGPRYCPSIEDKVTRFGDRDRHQVFLEPEGLLTKEIYVQGVSSSLPVEVQMALYKKIDGLENCEFMRPAYAIEYDAIDATRLDRSLEVMGIDNLYMAGQINGSSGYEEAAAQGLVAGVNAALSIQDKDPLILRRDQAYIGVLIDDLVTKGTREPYRMMTARAEYRLTLRQDNADLRLTEIGRSIGLVNDEQYERFIKRRDAIENERERLASIQINPTDENIRKLDDLGSATLKNATPLLNLMQRPELTYDKLAVFDENRPLLPRHVIKEVETEVRYKGYIEKQMAQIQKFRKMENKILSKDLDYNAIKGLRNEAKEKLSAIRPESVGQAGRISGVSPADINVLLIYLEQKNREANNELGDA